MIKRKQTVTEIVIDRIRTYITENQCQPGDRLPTEKEIVDMLGVSRTSVREALKSLQSNGIIEMKQGSGIFVKEVKLQNVLKSLSPFLHYDQAKFKEIIDTRMILELGAVELAIEHDQVELIHKMKHWNELLLEKIKRGEKAKTEDFLFHKALFQATGNETFIQLSSMINDYFNMNQLEEVTEIEDYLNSYQEHKIIIEAIIDKNVNLAKNTMRTHLSHLYHFLD
ncbi:FadR/GntR family transcriptional regulator [Bacillus sp. JJ1533]|uniref:FadR/GntR family transcriptional regulator n=1 Tax=Bacillus sp. JJ1533 TaxID=3122959 RepID=UPI003000EA55